MKKKLTMLVAGLLPAMMITAQEPVVVSGDVHVGTSAVLSSKGSVGLRSGDDSNKAMIVNKGTLKLNGGVSFHSTDEYTGVLLNEYSAGGTVDLSGVVNPALVSVKKTFKKGSWYYMSFPFEVNLSSLKVEGSNFNSTYFRVYLYDVQKRADGSSSAGGSENWVQITDFTNGKLTANQGYILAVSSSYDGVEIEFPAASGLSELYSKTDNGNKSQKLSYDVGTSSEENWGWNFIGNPHSSNFKMSMATTGYEGSVYHWDSNASNFIATPLDAKSVVVRPFTPVFVQSWEEEMIFNFKAAGMTQEDFTPGLRSAANDMGFIELKLEGEEIGYDLYSLILANEGNPGRNAAKMFSPGGEAPQLWASVDDKSYSVSQMSFDGFVEVPLVVQLGENSHATLSLSELRNASYDQISLVDLVEGKVFDLLNGEVCSVSNQNREEGRYLLRVGAGSTGVEEKFAQGVDIRVKEGQLILSNLIEADLIRVYNTSGVLVADRLVNASEEIIPLPGSGIYIVQISGTNSLVKKVINP